jgi:DNA-binding transcriptional LysR family regulator
VDIDLLRTFLEVYRTRHFGKAADSLCISQSAVSARIRLLEDTLSAPVFYRRRGDLQLTPTGQRLLRHAETIVTAWSRARQEVVAEQTRAEPLAVGGVPSLWDTLLSGWLRWLVGSVDSVRVDAQVLAQEQLVRRLVDRTLDLAFMFEPPAAQELTAVPVARLQLVLVSSRPEHRVEQALGADYVLVDWGPSFAVQHARLFPDLAAPRVRLSLGRIARDFILAAGGSAYLAEPLVTRHLAKGRLFRVAGAPVLERDAFAVYPADAERSSLITHALDYFEPAKSRLPARDAVDHES